MTSITTSVMTSNLSQVFGAITLLTPDGDGTMTIGCSGKNSCLLTPDGDGTMIIS